MSKIQFYLRAFSLFLSLSYLLNFPSIVKKKFNSDIKDRADVESFLLSNRLNSNRNSNTKSRMHYSTSTKKSRRKMTFSMKWIESLKWTSFLLFPFCRWNKLQKNDCSLGGIQVAHEGEVPNAIKRDSQRSFLKIAQSIVPEFKYLQQLKLTTAD